MNPFLRVNLTYVIWFMVVLWLFSRYPVHRALLIAFVAGAMFLPEVKLANAMRETPTALSLGSLFALTKANVISVAALLGVFINDSQRLFAFRPRWYDAPMILWCLSPLVSDYLIGEPLNNLYGQTRDQTLVWGVPYILGRIYLNDLERFREAAQAIVYGALAYVPFCLFEIVKDPYLHWMIYGYHQHDPSQNIRGGGNRPIVFMDHGLATSLWMVAGAMVAIWLWHSRTFTSLKIRANAPPLPMMTVAAILGLLAVICKSTGALMLGIVGLVVLYCSPRVIVPLGLIGLLAIPASYIGARTEGGWTGEELIAFLQSNFEKERVESVAFRLRNENRLMIHVKKNDKSTFGLGDTGAALKMPKLSAWEDAPVPDGLWILTYAGLGYVGLTCLYVAMLLPAVLFAWKYSPSLWSTPAVAPLAVVSVFLCLYMIDCLSNAMINPVYILLTGGLTVITGEGLRQLPTRPAVVAMPEQSETVPEPAEEAVPTDGGAAVEEPAAAPPPGVLVRRRPFGD